MQNKRIMLLQGIGFAAVYFLISAISVLYLRTAHDVVLFWPAAGLSYAVVLRYGRPLALAIPVAQLLLHLVLVPVPAGFLPYSLCSNFIATLLAHWYATRNQRRLTFHSTEHGFLLLRGGVLLAACSAAIGCLGMLQTGMAGSEVLLRNFLQWALGDLLGITAIVPSVLYLSSRHRRRHALPASGNRRERIVWSAGMAVLLVGGVMVIRSGSLYPLSLAGMPLALLLWAAARYPPAFTAVATMIVTILLALALGLGINNLPRPETLQDTALMMGSLVVYSVAPMMLVASYQERFETMAALHSRATLDPLTGLLNRDTFEEQARMRLAESFSPQSLLYIDLDHFKLVNDSASHAAGDEMLRNAAALVRAEFGEDALIAHGGGDEFLVLLALDQAGAGTRGRRLLAAIEAMRIAWQGQNLSTTASIGLVASQPPHAAYDELLSQGDTACHEAKERGGNYLFAAKTDSESLSLRTDLMRSAIAAKNALDHHRFELWCQPIVAFHTPAPLQSHFEVLLRWRDGEGRLRQPAELIVAAERYRLGPRLDRYMLDAALRWLEAHPADAARVEQCSINLGAATLVDEDFSDYFANRLRRSSLRPEQLCLEITETSVVRDLTRAKRFIARMRELGCKFALDDFGTGFCSFGYLRDLDVDYLKIDGSFVRDLDSSPLAEAVVRSITDIAHLLDMRAIAEQAETKLQMQRLRKLRVDFAQGYFHQRPKPIYEFFAKPNPGQSDPH